MQYQNKIHQVIKRLGKEPDLVLMDIFLDGVTKYLTSEWQDNNANGDEYDGDHDGNGMPRQATRYLTAPLRL